MTVSLPFLSASDVDIFSKQLPKAELHLHLGGSYPLEYVLSIATEAQKAQLLNFIEKLDNGLQYQEAFEIFTIISQIVNTEERVINGVTALCQEQEKEGVRHLEIRTGLKDFGQGYEPYLQNLLKAINQSSNEKLKITLLLSLKRNSSPLFSKLTVDLAIKYKQLGVVGIDVSGDSTVGDLTPLFSDLQRAKDNGLFLTIHMGEALDEKDQYKILETLKPHRIGHGVFLTAEALQWVLDNRIPIEVCLTSSKIVHMTERFEDHPALNYYLLGHPIIICTDDPLIFRTSLSKEYKILYEHCSFSLEQIEKLSNDSFSYSF